MLAMGMRDGECMERMFGINENDMKRYRSHIDKLYDSDEKKDDAIYIIDRILRVILDKEFGNCPIQLARNHQKDLSSQGDSCRAKVGFITKPSEEP